MQQKSYELQVGGKTLTATFTDLAERAHGSVLVRYGDTVILVTAVMSKHAKEAADFFPLTVDYEEKFYASGQILGSKYVRREGKPSDEAILSGRIVDRTIRPLFDQYMRHEVQVIVTILSLNEEDPDVLAVIGASLALGTSHIPWNGPVSAIRIAKTTNTSDLLINPSYTVRENPEAEFELIACGKDGKINMIELGAKEISETAVNEALKKASEEIEKIQTWQKQIIAEIGKQKKSIPAPEIPTELTTLFQKEIAPQMETTIFTGTPGDAATNDLGEAWMELVKKELPDHISHAYSYFEEQVNALIHKEAIDNNRRADGRGIDEIRPLYAQAGGISPILHGSGIFYRGQTHILSALTLGGPQDSQQIEGMEESTQKRYMHHYNFPPFSTGETGRAGGTNRRMIGHGALAEKAILPVLPEKEVFPYTIRIVSEALSSNGSTSMGSVCGSTLALMDAGVPIKRPVAGIASGLMMRDEKNYKVLTDIQGPEDHHGDMDFKVAGTREGITAIQMDVKVEGIPLHILTEAFEKAKTARHFILDKIESAIPAPRQNLSPRAPRIGVVKIKQEQIGAVIGPGGKVVTAIREKTKTEIEIEDDGTVYITGLEPGVEEAKKIISDMTREYKKGDRFEGTVTRIMDFGVFVRISESGTEGLVHVSEMATFRIEKVQQYVKEGDRVPVVVKEIDEKKRINLSIKEANPSFFIKKEDLNTPNAQ